MLHTKDETNWVLLQTFFKGRKEKTYIHRNLLNQFLDNHFKNRRNDFHSVFVRSDVKLEEKKTHRISSTNYPAIIISYDARHVTPICAALFDDSKPLICDIHDCKMSDVLALNNDNIISSIDQFVTDPGLPKNSMV